MEVASGDDERRRTQDSTNADLRKGEKELTDVEELRRVAVVLWSKNRVMQRPESVKTRFPTVAAAELERQKRECEEEDDRRK